MQNERCTFLCQSFAGLINTQCEAFRPLPDPFMGLREGQEQGEESGKGG
jgi:hypothetical protein